MSAEPPAGSFSPSPTLEELARENGELRRQIAELTALRDREFRDLSDSMPQIVWRASPTGAPDYFSRRWFELIGTQGEQTGDAFSPFLHHDDRPKFRDAWEQAVRTGEPFQMECRFQDCSTGQSRWHLCRALPVRDEQGRIVRWFGTCTEIHEQKQLQEALRQADQRKDEFLAVLAHELRNPLSPLTTALELIRMLPGQPPEARELADLMSRQIEQLVRLIDDLLDVSRISSGKLELRRGQVDLNDAVNSALDVSRAPISTAGHELHIALADRPLLIHGDRVRLAQVVSNLLINAAKYTPPGGRIELQVKPDGSDAVITVRDTGIGIPRDLLSKIFELFMQVDSSSTRAQGGLGIGLTLAKTLVQMHGGVIGASSDGPGTGSQFTVRLPLSGAPAPPPAEVNVTGGLPVFRVLVVDDNQSAGYLLSRLLGVLGQTVRVENAALAAIARFAEFQPDIVFSDIAMPDISGYELAARLRQIPRDVPPILVALTGYGQDSDRRQALEAGFDHHFTKPIGLANLETFLRSLGPATK